MFMPQRDHIPHYKTKMTTYWFVYYDLQNFGDTVTYFILKLKTNPPVSFSSSNVLKS